MSFHTYNNDYYEKTFKQKTATVIGEGMQNLELLHLAPQVKIQNGTATMNKVWGFLKNE